ncbi:MAG: PASTA domain-containing protein [Clostridia bacterium]|nr:PASTA domain-containing protein [Clostridia bacterium]
METMRYRCLACLTEFDEGTSCPACGFDGRQTDQMPYIRIGELLRNRYRIGRRVAANAESATYLAFDREQKRAVYVQEYFPQDVCGRMSDGRTLAISGQGENSFLRGVKPFRDRMEALKANGGEGVLEVRDVFTENKTIYAVTRNGSSTLAQLMQKKENPLSWNQTARIFRPVLDSLIALRPHGVGHYGIAPENLYLSSDGRMRLGGFVSKTVRKTGNSRPAELYTGFSAPEQYEAESVLAETADVYAVCACMLYAVTKIIPKDAVQRKEDPKLVVPEEMADAIPPFVIKALARGLQVQPERRFQTLEQLRQALYNDGEEPSAVPIAVLPDTNEENIEELNVQMPEKTKTAAKKVRYYRLPNFISCLLAFVVTFAILFHVFINYVRNDPDYPYLDLGVFGPSLVSSDTSGDTPPLPPSSVPSNPSSGTSSVQIPEGAIEVPNFVGMNINKAMENKNFKILLSQKEFSDQHAEGTILEQSVTGYAQPGSAIAVTISLGSKERKLPKVVGKSLEEARKILEESGFRVGTVTEETSSSYAENTVIRFDGSFKAGNKYDYGTAIDLIVSKK